MSSDGAIKYIDYLPANGRVVGAERAVAVAGYDAPVIGCFYPLVERVAGGYVVEVRAAGGVDGPIRGQDNHFTKLGAGDVVAPMESAVGITGYRAPVVSG